MLGRAQSRILELFRADSMDKTWSRLLSGYVRLEVSHMPFDRAKVIKKVFDSTGLRNPLRELRQVDKHLLWSLLTIYMFESQEGKPDRVSLALEEMGKIAADAVALAKRIQLEVVNDESWEVVKVLARGRRCASASLSVWKPVGRAHESFWETWPQEWHVDEKPLGEGV
jgi:hypothetical protein